MDRRDDYDPNRPPSDRVTDRYENQPHTTDTAGDVVGEVTGGVAGAATGAALGSLGGPIGTLIGALAGAIGGWWSGRAISEAAHEFTEHDEAHYRDYHTTASPRAPQEPRNYDDVRPAYQLGHLAGRNPEYANRSFDDIETDLQRGWTSDVSARHGDWSDVRHYARDAYERGRTTPRGTALGTSERGMSGAADRATNSGPLDRLADKADDLKDRVDGNPASRPGPDATDRRI
jgi:hypothetical protein